MDMRQKQFSVLLFAGKHDIPLRPLHVLRCLARIPEVNVHLLSQNPWQPVRFSRYLRSFHQLYGSSEEDQIERIRQVAATTHADVLFPVTISEVRIVSARYKTVRACLPVIPSPRYELLDMATDKVKMANFLEQHNMPGPPTILYRESQEFEEQLRALPFPVILKPLKGGGGRHIRTFRSADVLLDFLGKKVWKFSGNYIVQSFLDGYDVHCHLLCQEGKILAYTDSRSFLPNVRRFGRPSGIEFVHDQKVFEWMTAFITELRWHGMAHVDLRYDRRDEQLKLIDFNADWDITILGAARAGVNFPYLACLAGLGETFPRPEYALTRFVSGKAALRRSGDAARVRYGETSWAYACRDPLAEFARFASRLFF